MLALLALLVLAPSARAEDTYTVHYCRAPGGGLADTTAFSDINPKARLGRNCPGQGVSAGPPIAEFSQLEGFSVRYAVPAATRLVGYDLYRTVTVSAGWNYCSTPTRPTVWTPTSSSAAGGGAARGSATGPSRRRHASASAASTAAASTSTSTAIPARAQPAARRA